MAYPSFASQQTSYTAFQQGQGDNSFPGQQLDIDLQNLKATVDTLNQFVRNVVRADNELGNQTVGPEQLKSSLVLGISPPTGWLTGTSYSTQQTVFADGGYYLCLTAHTATSFASDLSSGYWLRLIDFDPYVQTTVDTAVGAIIDDAASDAVTSSIDAAKLIPQVTSTTALAAVPTAVGKAVRLTDSLRGATYVWDPTMTSAQYGGDTEELNAVAPDPGNDGAWVNPLGDPRLGYWSNSATPGRFLRSKSGIKIGDAANFLGATAGNNGDTDTWLADIDLSWMQHGTIFCARSNGSVGATIAVRNSGSNTNNAFALMLAAYNTNTNSTDSTQALYAEGISGLGHAGHCCVVELEAVNFTGPPANDGHDPYVAPVSALRYGMVIGSGGAHPGTLYDIDFFLRFINNGARSKTGIIFRGNALARSGDENTGLARAILLGQTHALSWYAYSGGAEAFRFYANVDTSSKGQELFFTDAGMFFRQMSGSKDILRVVRTDNVVNYANIVSAATGDPVSYEARGSDTDIDLMLSPKGDGLVQFDYESTVASVSANFSATRYLPIKDLNGVTLYIPCRVTPW